VYTRASALPVRGLLGSELKGGELPPCHVSSSAPPAHALIPRVRDDYLALSEHWDWLGVRASLKSTPLFKMQASLYPALP
jgi:hypothetical protein